MSQDTIAAQQEHDGRINRRVNVIAFLGLAYLATILILLHSFLKIG